MRGFLILGSILAGLVGWLFYAAAQAQTVLPGVPG